MLRIVQQTSEASAKAYFKSGGEGYYGAGVWGGEGAKRLGLDGEVTWPEFERLCENRDPRTGEKLTPINRSGRRIGYDCSFHAPKSLSLIVEWTLSEDLIGAFQTAIKETMAEIELEARTRVRLGGVQDDSRLTGNLCYASFLHRTTRPLDDGEPDPHLHLHVFIFNATWDHTEGRWKALDFSAAKKMARYFEACFHSRLTWKLRELGYPLSRTRKGWEIAGVSETLRGKFSRRTREIETLAERLKIRNPEEKAKLGARTRKSKTAARSMNPEDLRTAWAGRMTFEERESLSRIQRDRRPSKDNGLSKELTARSLDRSAAHHFERSSTVPRLWILETALRWGLGWVLPSSAREELERRVGEKSLLEASGKITSPGILEEELRLVTLAKAGRGKMLPILTSGRGDLGLSREQLVAVQGILDSRDRVSLLVGRAGTGKTTLLKALKEALGEAGYGLRVFAPTAEASRGVLRSEGFEDAETVSRLLEDTRLQFSIHSNSVILVDEAGMLPIRSALKLLELSERSGARLVLCGDPFQHGSVERGCVMNLMMNEAGLIPATLAEIRRQKGDYKRTVEAMADGDVERGLEVLDDLGWIEEEPDLEARVRSLALAYADAIESKKSILVVSPTHLEGEAATLAIREELRERGVLKEERLFSTLVAVKMTEAEKRNPCSYVPGDVLVSHGGTRQEWREGMALPKGKRLEVFRPVALPVAEGDVVRITRNGKSLEGKELRNGATYKVLGFTKDGDAKLSLGITLPKENGFLTHGYVSTSHASQGRTVDRVLLLQGSESRPAASMAQAYVSISRGRESVRIFTDDKAALLQAVRRSDDRETAMGLLGMAHEAFRWLRERLPSRTMAA